MRIPWNKDGLLFSSGVFFPASSSPSTDSLGVSVYLKSLKSFPSAFSEYVHGRKLSADYMASISLPIFFLLPEQKSEG